MSFLFPLLFLIPFPDTESEQKPNTLYLAFENLGVFDPLPLYTSTYTDEAFEKWARAQNQVAYQVARERADNWLIRNPALDTYVQDNDYTSTSDLDQDEAGTSNGISVGATSSTRYFGHSIQRTYRTQTRWGGGLVVLINPYVRQ